MDIVLTVVIAVLVAGIAGVVLFALFHKQMDAGLAAVSAGVQDLKLGVGGALADISSKVTVIHHETVKSAQASANAAALKAPPPSKS
jgi:hypothetical protein